MSASPVVPGPRAAPGPRPVDLRSPRLRDFSALALTSLLFYSIAVLWMQQRWPWAVFQISVFALAAAWILRPMPWIGSIALVPLAGAVLWGAAQLAFGRTVYPWVTWMSVLDWFTDLTVAFLALQVFAGAGLRNRFLCWVSTFAVALSAESLVQMFTAQGKIFWLFASPYSDHVLGPFLYRNQYAAFMELLLPLVLWQALHHRRRGLLYAAAAGIMFASVIAGASRAGFVLAASEILVFLILAFHKRILPARRAAFLLGQLLVLGAVSCAIAGWGPLWTRLRQPDAFAGRREIAWSAVEMIRARPVWGFGLGTWQVSYPRYAHFDDGTYVNQAHNDWAQWAVEGGLPLLLLIAGLALLLVRPAIRSVWGIGPLFVLAHAAVDYPFQQRPALAAWFFLFMVLIIHADGQRRATPGAQP